MQRATRSAPLHAFRFARTASRGNKVGKYKRRAGAPLFPSSRVSVAGVPDTLFPASHRYTIPAFYRILHRAFPILQLLTASAVPVVDSSLPLAGHKSLLLAFSVFQSKLNCSTRVICTWLKLLSVEVYILQHLDNLIYFSEFVSRYCDNYLGSFRSQVHLPAPVAASNSPGSGLGYGDRPRKK